MQTPHGNCLWGNKSDSTATPTLKEPQEWLNRAFIFVSVVNIEAMEPLAVRNALEAIHKFF